MHSWRVALKNALKIRLWLAFALAAHSLSIIVLLYRFCRYVKKDYVVLEIVEKRLFRV